jgi:hypothetical protein
MQLGFAAVSTIMHHHPIALPLVAIVNLSASHCISDRRNAVSNIDLYVRLVGFGARWVVAKFSCSWEARA